VIQNNNILNNYKKKFNENGFVILKNALNKKTLTNFSKSLAYLINASSVKGIRINNIRKKNTEHLKQEILRNLLHLEKKNHSFIAKIYDTIRDLNIMDKVFNNQKINKLIYSLLSIEDDVPIYVKQKACRIDMPKNNDFSLDWHQESPYTIKNTDLIQIWAPALENINSENGAIKILPGSHKEGHLKTEDYFPKIGHAQYVPKKNILKKYNEKSIELKIGDVMLFSKFLIHRSGENNSFKPRLTFIAHYHNPIKKDFFKNFIYKGDKPLKKNSYKR
jgi:ectoine hydroxylase-related dioxygenase (phytanoyl-CoA dioxygenase family)